MPLLHVLYWILRYALPSVFAASTPLVVEDPAHIHIHDHAQKYSHDYDHTNVHDLPPPAFNQAYMSVSALEAGLVDLPSLLTVSDATPNEVHTVPSLAFLLTHSQSGKRIVFDLGLRRDTDAYAPYVQMMIDKWMPVTVPQNVEESLRMGGLEASEVETVVLSHLHFDHIGDPSPFTNATFLVGADAKPQITNGYPINPTASETTTCLPLSRTHFLPHSLFDTSIGPFPHAYDYFGDGSLYIIDAPGHNAGHINVLTRTSETGGWIYLAGDSAHDVRLLTGEREVAEVEQGGNGQKLCLHGDKKSAETHIRRVGELMKRKRNDVHVLIAHDWEWYEKEKKTGGKAFWPGVIPAMA